MYLVPQGGQRLLTFIDDLHMPIRDSTGEQTAIEVLREYIEFSGWHQLKNQ